MSDSILEGFGEPIVEVDEKEFEDKLKKISPFDFVNSINYSKENLIASFAVKMVFHLSCLNDFLLFNAKCVFSIIKEIHNNLTILICD